MGEFYSTWSLKKTRARNRQQVVLQLHESWEPESRAKNSLFWLL